MLKKTGRRRKQHDGGAARRRIKRWQAQVSKYGVA